MNIPLIVFIVAFVIAVGAFGIYLSHKGKRE
jgi:hypothetical protein